jgi:D-arabinonate dehydratase
VNITDVRVRLLSCPLSGGVVADATHRIPAREVILVEVATDTGHRGLGFLTGLSQMSGAEGRVIAGIIRDGLAPMVVGEDPFRTEHLWARMYRGSFRLGRRGAAVRALSGVDIALWDLIGRATGQPLWRLLGGYRDTVQVYASGGFYAGAKGIDGLVAEMAGYMEHGFAGVKMKVGAASLAEDTERIRAVRDAIGPAAGLLVDANEVYDPDTAIRALRRWERYDLAWLEEPVSPDDVPGMAKVAAASDVPIAVGENEYTKHGFRELIQNRAADVLQPDVTRVGGVTEWRKVAAMAEAEGLRVAPHAVHELHVHLAAAAPNCSLIEFFTPEAEIQEFLAHLFVQPVLAPRDGVLALPTAPGFGLEVDEDVARRHEVPPASHGW